MSDYTTLELQLKTIGNQETKLQQQEVHILELQNEINTMSQRLKGAQEKSQLDCNTSYLQQKILTKIKIEIRTQENPILESKCEINNLNKELKCAESNQIEDLSQQKYIEKDYSSLKAIKHQISGIKSEVDLEERRNESNKNIDNINNSLIVNKNTEERDVQFLEEDNENRNTEKRDVQLFEEYNEHNSEIKKENKLRPGTNVAPIISSKNGQVSTAEKFQQPVSKKNQVKGAFQTLHCQICSKAYSRNSELEVHVNAVHLKIKPFKCEICPKAFGRRHHLTEHVDSVHNNIRRFKCKICCKHFLRNAHLKVHVDEVHKKLKNQVKGAFQT
jgi:hypothetical protein